MPSAKVSVSPNSRHIETAALNKICVLGLSTILSVRLLSNFTVSKCTCDNNSRLEKLVPKSSMEILNPASCIRLIKSTSSSFSSKPKLSVISTSIRHGSIPYFLQIATLFLIVSSAINVTRETFTDILKTLPPRSRQSFSIRQTVFRTKMSI